MATKNLARTVPRSGAMNGTSYWIDIPGRLLSATPYSRGFEHGVARQWADDGRLLGTYRMHHGTGIDLWWDETWRKPRKRFLAEVHFMHRGQPHGFEWWISEDQASVHEERHWRDGRQHGIERAWTLEGRLRRGYPKYSVAGQRATRRQYIKAAANDASLPRFRKAENRPRRVFPPVIARHLGDRRGRARGWTEGAINRPRVCREPRPSHTYRPAGRLARAALVFSGIFESKEDADRVAEIEQTSQECLDFFQVMEAPDPTLPDMGVLSFEHIKTYERR